uniref:RNA-dependent RNA polymerase n=1 Tax=Diaporthe helianthi mitovirus 2 TaxID=3077434 RepID=A0AA96HG47_9VIRU|nr:MAG: RNA-dependent RNA polymerase [Diaporthe helianthi mitovirus 2]
MKEIKLWTQTLNMPVIRIGSVKSLSVSLVKPWILVLTWALRVPKEPFMLFGERIIKLWKINGAKFVVQYLKESSLFVTHYVSGSPLWKSNLPVGIAGGLPTIIPGVLRLSIKDGDQLIIRGVLSVLSMYRVILIPGIVKLSSITSKFTGKRQTFNIQELSISFTRLRLPRDFNPSWNLKGVKLLHSISAGPNNPVSMLGIYKDILTWTKNPYLLTVLTRYLIITGNKSFLARLTEDIDLVKQWMLDCPCDYYNSLDHNSLSLGKLAFKDEPAGKVRVFAIADAITQAVLKPLHKCLFAILKDLPMDGTFDQSAPIDRLLRLTSKQECTKFYSYDLSSATDRLPVSLQRDVLSYLYNNEMADLWKELLVGRTWRLPKSSKRYTYDMNPLPESVKYEVGQPMGALSSWAMLALTHHIIVQIAASRIYPDRVFTLYALLGDDIVIADEKVAKVYYDLMTLEFGVEINLSKSLQSNHMLEFAKRLISVKGGEVTPIGAKTLSLALSTPQGLISVLVDMTNKGFLLQDKTIHSMISKLPFKYGKTFKDRLTWAIVGPFGFIPTSNGVSAGIKLHTSLLPLEIRLLGDMQETKYILDLRAYARALKESLDSLIRIRVWTDFGLPGLQPGSLWNQYLKEYKEYYLSLLFNKPHKDFSLGARLMSQDLLNPVSNKYALTQFIQNKLNEGVLRASVDPFQDDNVLLPFKASKSSENFFSLLKEVSNVDNTSVLRNT